MKKPRVLLVQRVLAHYRRGLFEALSNRPTFQLDVAYGDARRGSSLQSEVAPPGLRTIRLRNFYLGRSEILSYQAGLSGLLKRGSYDVVVAEFNTRIISNVLACLRFGERMRFVWWGHGFGPNAGPLIMKLRLYLASRADAVVFYDESRANRFIDGGLAREKVYVARNAVDVAAIEGLREEVDLEQRKNLVYIGRLIPTKRVDVLLRAFERARAALPSGCRLVIIGDGPERDNLTCLAAQLGIAEAVDFVGPVFDDRLLAPHFNSAWVSLCAGRVGLNAIHSLAFGVPMIASSDPGHGPEIAALRDHETALLVGPAAPESIAAAMVELRRRSDEWARMSRACRELVARQYSLDAMVDVMERAILGPLTGGGANGVD